jgi:MFS family permease
LRKQREIMDETMEVGVRTTESTRDPFGVRLIAPLALGSMLNPINSTMIATALVPIARDFHATVAATSWLIGGLYITSAIAQPTMGRLADCLGARRVYLAGLYLIALAGIAGIFAPSLRVLIGVRVLLGIGTSAAYPTAMKILRNQVAKTTSVEPRMALGILSMSALSTMALGPALGGILTGLGGWRMIFSVNLPLALVGILFVFMWIPTDETKPNGFGKFVREIDFIGITFFTGLLLTAMLFLNDLAHPNWLLLVLFVVLGILVVLHSLHKNKPFIDIRMLVNNLPLTVTYIRYGTFCFMVYCMLYGFSQWLQSGPGLSSTKAGLVTLPMSILAAVSALVGGRLKSIRNPLIFGTAGLVFAAGCIAVITSGTTTLLLTVLVLPFGIPQGIFSNANQAAVYQQARQDELGTAAGLLRTSQYVGAIVAASLLGLFFGKHPTDHGMHALAWVMVVLSAALLIVTVMDRTLPSATVSKIASSAQRAKTLRPHDGTSIGCDRHVDEIMEESLGG